MNDLINAIQEGLGYGGSKYYRAEVEVSLRKQFYNTVNWGECELLIGYQSGITTVEKIDFEARVEAASWGIKGISIEIPDQDISIPYRLEDSKGNVVEEGYIDFNPAAIKSIDNAPSDGRGITIDTVELSLDSDFKVIMEESEIQTVNFIP